LEHLIHFGNDAYNVGISAFVLQLDKQRLIRQKLPYTRKGMLSIDCKLEGPYIKGRNLDVFMDHEDLKYLNKKADILGIRCWDEQWTCKDLIT
jgi:hypothetical protein